MRISCLLSKIVHDDIITLSYYGNNCLDVLTEWVLQMVLILLVIFRKHLSADDGLFLFFNKKIFI